mmetsp:Transcript_962/g.2510  ORF Transcript_962/g.2510 Transcript_962/m.2510 type:complete len:204 (-) Transcript_962:1019-1630(-)
MAPPWRSGWRRPRGSVWAARRDRRTYPPQPTSARCFSRRRSRSSTSYAVRTACSARTTAGPTERRAAAARATGTQTATIQRLTRSTLRRNRGFPTRPRLTPTTRRPGRTRRGSQCPRGRPRPRSRSSATTTSTAKAPRDRPVTATTSAINPGATLRKPGPGPPSPRRVHPCAEGSTLGSSCHRPSAWRPSWMEALGRAPRLSA